MDIRILYCIGLLLLVIKPVPSAEIKKWVDQDGQVHFGDYAPHGADTTQVDPEITTVAPSSNDSLKEIMRPGELRMIKNYEKRGKRLIKAKRKSLKQARLSKKRAAKAKKKCSYYKDKVDDLERKLRKGYKRSERNWIEERIAKYNQQIEEYCD